MAGDWIKIEHALPDKPEVSKLAEILAIDPDAVTGKLIRFWLWCDLQSVNGNALGVTETHIDRLTHQPGFSAALLKVGWLQVRSGSLEVPRFDRHNGQTAKARAVTSRRVSEHRQREDDKCNGASVTKSLPEKRREEKSKKDAVADAPAAAAPKPKREPSGPHQTFIASWTDYYLDRTQSPYPFGGRDGKAVKQLLDHFGTPEEAWGFIKSVHARSSEGYPFANGETLYDLANNIAKLQAALAKCGDKKPASLFLS